MLLAFEIPTKHLEEFVPLEDFEFGLAHLFLRKDYPGWEEYHKMYRGCLLDNGMYELGAPMSTETLLTAAELAKPMAVIAPDWMDDYRQTLDAAYALQAAKPQDAKWTVGVVVQGKDYFERETFFMEARRNRWSPICFPFRSPRNETIKQLAQKGLLQARQWFHLLGLRAWEELMWQYSGLWSIDTSKPFKGYKVTSQPCRGQGPVKLHDEMSFTARRLAGWNISFMRQLMQYGERQHLRELLAKKGKKK